jgi:hypothetical protein
MTINQILIVFGFIGLAAPAMAATLTDDQVREAIIRESIASYPGTCPCPWSIARNGSHCGKRSAWSKPGGYDPVCYPTDVTPDMIKRYRQSH